MGLLGRLGNVGGALLENQLRVEEKKREEDALYARQAALQESGILSGLAQSTLPKVLSGEVDPNQLPPALRRMLAGSHGPSDEQRLGELITDWSGSGEHGIKTSQGLTREEIIGQMQAKRLPTGDIYDLTKQRQFSDADGTMGNGEEGLLPAYTRGAYEENPLVTQAGTTAGAIGGRIQKEDQQKAADELQAKGAEKLLPGRPETIGILQLDQNKRPVGAYVLGADGKPRHANEEDMRNPDIKWQPESATPPNYYQMMQQVGPMDLRGKMAYASQANSLGWQHMPPLYGPSGQMDRNAIVALQPFEDKANPGHFIFENPNYTGPLPKGVTPDDVARLRAENSGGQGQPSTPDLFGNRIKNLANQKSLGDITETYNSVRAFGRMANDNAAILNDIMKKLPDSGVQFLNTEVRDLANQLGAPAMAAFAAARRAVYTDYARLTTTPRLTGVLSNQAQAETEKALEEGATVGQVLAALDVWKKETMNRENELKGILDELGRTRNGIIGPDSPAAPTTAAPTTPAHRPGIVRR